MSAKNIADELSKKKSVVAAQRLTRRFEAYARTRRQPAFPIRIEVLLDFLCQYVNDNGGSAKSVNKVAYAIKKHCEIHRLGWLDTADNALLERSVKHLMFVDEIPSEQKQPLGYSLLVEVTKNLNSYSRRDIRLKAMFWVSYEGALRSDELLGGRCLQDINWSEDYTKFTLSLKRTKTHRKGPPLQISYTDNAIIGGPSAVKFLREYFDAYALWTQPKQSLLFPSPHITANPKSMSTAWFRLQVKRSVSDIGLDPSQYSSHSFRAGLATDMFRSDVPLQTVQWAGRWRSICALLYYRDNVDRQLKVQAAITHVRQAHKKPGIHSDLHL